MRVQKQPNRPKLESGRSYKKDLDATSQEDVLKYRSVRELSLKPKNLLSISSGRAGVAVIDDILVGIVLFYAPEILRFGVNLTKVALKGMIADLERRLNRNNGVAVLQAAVDKLDRRLAEVRDAIPESPNEAETKKIVLRSLLEARNMVTQRLGHKIDEVQTVLNRFKALERSSRTGQIHETQIVPDLAANCALAQIEALEQV